MHLRQELKLCSRKFQEVYREWSSLKRVQQFFLGLEFSCSARAGQISSPAAGVTSSLLLFCSRVGFAGNKSLLVSSQEEGQIFFFFFSSSWHSTSKKKKSKRAEQTLHIFLCFCCESVAVSQFGVGRLVTSPTEVTSSILALTRSQVRTSPAPSLTKRDAFQPLAIWLVPWLCHRRLQHHFRPTAPVL